MIPIFVSNKEQKNKSDIYIWNIFFVFFVKHSIAAECHEQKSAHFLHMVYTKYTTVKTTRLTNIDAKRY